MPDELNAVQMVALVLLAMVAAAGALLPPRIWRGELAGTYERVSRDMWLWGEPLRRGFIRGLHLAILGTLVLVFLVFATADLEPTASMDPVAGTAVVLLFTVLALLGSVILFNRPRGVVPPYARDQAGAVHEWRAGLRARWHHRRGNG